MKLIPNWKQSYKAFSVQALAFIAFVQGILMVMPPTAIDARVPFIDMSWRDLGVSLTVAAAVLGGLGRLIDQGIETPPT